MLKNSYQIQLQDNRHFMNRIVIVLQTTIKEKVRQDMDST